MLSEIGENIIRFILLMLFQILIVNQIELSELGYATPYVYILFIFMLPIQMPPWAIMVISFFAGLIADSFMNSWGVQASAAVMIAFVRTFLLNMLSPREGYVPGEKISIQHLGLTWFLIYAGILTFLFHFWLFFFEKFRLGDIFYTLGKILISTIVALLIIILIQYLLIKPSKSNV